MRVVAGGRKMRAKTERKHTYMHSQWWKIWTQSPLLCNWGDDLYRMISQPPSDSVQPQQHSHRTVSVTVSRKKNIVHTV